MVKVTIDLADLTGSWRITRIVVRKDGTGHPIKIEPDNFKYRSEAVRDAKMREDASTLVFEAKLPHSS